MYKEIYCLKPTSTLKANENKAFYIIDKYSNVFRYIYSEQLRKKTASIYFNDIISFSTKFQQSSSNAPLKCRLNSTAQKHSFTALV